MTGLPDSHFEELIHPHTGAVGHVRTPARGFSSDFAAVVEGEKGRFFVKAMFNVPGGRKDSLLREQAINPFVQPLSPSLVWSAGGDEDGWIILGFEVIEGRASRFEKGSSDLSAVVETLDRIAGQGLPEVAKSWSEDRWDRFATSASEAALFRGNTLIHSDINPSNIIIGERGTWVVDWSWPTRGGQRSSTPAVSSYSSSRPGTRRNLPKAGLPGARLGRVPTRGPSTHSPWPVFGCTATSLSGIRKFPG
ncbi:hypothetical protein [Streptomyces sp. MNP-20]|uniref:hypothetical protein n=1 Tax=Streptomyces sp. MNP-20 TaxID=2721165 RepID=UPI0020A62577|nr:hypothetical protein [Streptomyces sp. MNP-20]